MKEAPKLRSRRGDATGPIYSEDELIRMGIDSVSIHPVEDGGRPDGFGVYGWGEYPAWSVRAGRTRKLWLDHFERLADARAAYPFAGVSPHPVPKVGVFPPRAAPLR